MSLTTGMPAEQTSAPSGAPEVRSVYGWVSDAAQDNPALVVGGAVAVGALVALVLMNRRPQSRARAVEKRIGRELLSMEKMLRSSKPISTLTDRLADASGAVAAGVSSWGAEPLNELLRRATELSSQFARRGGWR